MERIVFFDGDCGLCQRSVAFLYRLDTHKKLFFAPLNGVTYKRYFSEPSDLSTVTFYQDKKLFIKSSALIEVGKYLGGWKKVAALIFQIIPLFIRDYFYDFVATYRRKVSCVILKKDQRFLP